MTDHVPDPEFDQMQDDALQLIMLPADHRERVAALVEQLQQAPDVRAGSASLGIRRRRHLWP